MEKGTDMSDFLCHAKRWNMTKKGGDGTFNYSRGGSGGVKYNLKCFNCVKVGCRPSKCNKPLNRELIEKNKRKYMADKEARTSNNPGGDCGDTSNRNKNINLSANTNSVEYCRKVWLANDMQMVNGCLKVNCREYGLKDTHSTKLREDWSNTSANFCLPNTHPFLHRRICWLVLTQHHCNQQQSPNLLMILLIPLFFFSGYNGVQDCRC